MKIKQSKLEKQILQVCKICGTKLDSSKCILHRDTTGHETFRPDFEINKEVE